MKVCANGQSLKHWEALQLGLLLFASQCINFEGRGGGQKGGGDIKLCAVIK